TRRAAENAASRPPFAAPEVNSGAAIQRGAPAPRTPGPDRSESNRISRRRMGKQDHASCVAKGIGKPGPLRLEGRPALQDLHVFAEHRRVALEARVAGEERDERGKPRQQGALLLKRQRRAGEITELDRFRGAREGLGEAKGEGVAQHVAL